MNRTTDPTDPVAGGMAIFVGDGSSLDDGHVLFQLVPPDLATSLRFLVARLQRDDGWALLQTLAITSALSGEGVSTVARGLAAIVAHDLDRRVCVLETNWWSSSPDDPANPTDQTSGLAGVLSGSCMLDDALVRTSDDRLTVLPAGRLPVGDRLAAAASTAFADVLEFLTKEFETVIIDTPPVLKASEATSIARRADSTALVVRQGVPTEAQVAAAIEELDGAELLGVIVNRTSTHVPRFLRRFVAVV